MMDIGKAYRMREIIKKEMTDIPKGNVEQNMFRQAYSALRLNSLGNRPQYRDRCEVINESTKTVRKEFPRFCPQIKEGSELNKCLFKKR